MQNASSQQIQKGEAQRAGKFETAAICAETERRAARQPECSQHPRWQGSFIHSSSNVLPLLHQSAKAAAIQPPVQLLRRREERQAGQAVAVQPSVLLFTSRGNLRSPLHAKPLPPLAGRQVYHPSMSKEDGFVLGLLRSSSLAAQQPPTTHTLRCRAW